MAKEVENGEEWDSLTSPEKIEVLRSEIKQLREEVDLLPDRIIERIRQEFKTISNPYGRVVSVSHTRPLLEDYTNRPLVTVWEASTITGLTRGALQRLAKNHTLPGFHDGRNWYLDKSAVESYKSPKKGRPKKGDS